ncbi:MAG: AbrB/MazE/SpoVT family DNA-binding domain-containing protein [Gemmatimonadaceae bacterium]
MDTVKVSPKFQVVIPRRVRELLKLKSGQSIQAFAYKGRIELVPIRTAKAMRGFARGVETMIDRDDDRL